MITFFTIPKAFSGMTGHSQRKALHSWKAVHPDAEVILCGNDPGVEECAAALGLGHYPGIRTNEFGTPLLSDAFSIVSKNARHALLMYINADIILMPGFVPALQRITWERFLIVGRRWDLSADLRTGIPSHGWQERVAEEIAGRRSLHGYSGIDYLIFPRNQAIDMPEFAVGRQGWDNWFLWRTKQMGIPLIDATETIVALHQRHDYSHSRFAEKERVGGPETRRNYRLAGGFQRMLSIRDADWLLTGRGLRRPALTRRFLGYLGQQSWWQWLLSLKRRIQSV